MKMIKSLVLGSAAGLLALSGAQAADLPVKAKAVEYVRICSLYGAGFFYIPGTDTCIKLGGYVRVDTTFNGGIYGAPAWSGDIGAQDRYRNYWAARSRLAINVDTRTATEYGVVRTYGQMDLNFSTIGNGTSFNPTTLATQLGNNTQLLDTPGGGYVSDELLFIQFAGFTFGKSASAFATPWQGYPGNNNSDLIGGHDSVTGVNNIQYTAQFGNGVSGTIGLEDPAVYSRTTILNLGVAGSATGAGAGAFGGVHAPDVAGNIRIDQAWGLFQIGAIAHDNNASYNILGPGGVPTALSEISGHPDDKWGGAVSAALQIKNIPTGAGDDFKIDTTFAKGATKEIISTSGSSPSFLMFGGSNRGYQSIGIGQTADAVYLPGVNGGTGDLKLVSAYGVRGAFNHNWDPYWSSSLWGSASFVRFGGNSNDATTAKGQWCANYIASNGLGIAGRVSADFSCNPDFNAFMAGMVTRWTPVKNLTFSAEVGWFGLDQKMTGTALLTPAAPKPTAVYEYKDQNTVFLNIRAQRNF